MRRAAALVAVLGIMLTGCSDKLVTTDEIDQLQDLPDVHVTLANEIFSMGGEDVRAGVAGGGREREDFAVLIGDDTPEHMTIAGKSYRLSSGCAGAGFYTRTDEFSTVLNTVEDAVYHQLAPDAYCEG